MKKIPIKNILFFALVILYPSAIKTSDKEADAKRFNQSSHAEEYARKMNASHDNLSTAMRALHERAHATFLLTIHRRESFNGGIQALLRTVKEFLVAHPHVHCIYPFHPNPHVLRALEESGIAQVSNISLFEPLAYQDMVYVLSQVSWVMTDSGGIQEEAVSLRKPVLVLREKTERMEGVWAGLAYLVGFDAECIKKSMHMLMHGMHGEDAHGASLYGDGYAAQRIASIVQSALERDPVFVQDRAVVEEVVAARVVKDELMQRVCVVGLGYIGLPTAIVIAENSIEVIGVDIDASRVCSINNGDPVIQEPSLFEKLHIALQSGAFRATIAIEHADYFIIAVPTPFNADKTADLAYVLSAVESIATVLKPGNVIILESTVPVGTTQKIAALLEQSTGLAVGRDFFVSYCPERVLPGNIFHELVENARIIGGVDMPSMEQAKWLYKKFVRGALYLTDSKTAEMVKLVENSSRDVAIAFANQVAAMAYDAGLNPYEVIELANKHPRVKVLTPTSGVGGHCIAVDPWFLIETFPESSTLLKNAREINDRKPYEVLSMIERAIDAWHAEHTGKKATVLLLGLTYKPDVDDMRESPAFAIAQQAQRWAHVSTLVSEPHISKALLAHHFGVHGVSVTDGLARADIVVFLVAHTRFKAIDKEPLKTKTIIDVCGILHEPQKQQQGEYFFWPAQGLVQETVGNVDKGNEI